MALSNFVGMHFIDYPVSGIGPKFGFGVVRTLGTGKHWFEIETSNGVYDWTYMDALVNYVRAQGAKLYIQVSGPPTFHATGPWAGVADYNEGRVGSAAMPNLTALAAYVTQLVTRYQPEYIGPCNETKLADNPIVYLKASSITGSLAVGNVITGATSGVSATITSINGTDIDVRMSLQNGNPFTVGEQIRKDGSNYLTLNFQRTRYYFHGSPSDAAQLSKTVYQTAKALKPDIIVMSPDFVDVVQNPSGNVDHISAWANASDGAGGYGKDWADMLGYHFYEFDTIANLSAGKLRSLSTGWSDLRSILSAIGKSNWKILAGEVGYTVGWETLANLQNQHIAYANLLARVCLFLAANGAEACVFFDFENNFCNDPQANFEPADMIRRLHNYLSTSTSVAITSNKYGQMRAVNNNGQVFYVT